MFYRIKLATNHLVCVVRHHWDTRICLYLGPAVQIGLWSLPNWESTLTLTLTLTLLLLLGLGLGRKG